MEQAGAAAAIGQQSATTDAMSRDLQDAEASAALIATAMTAVAAARSRDAAHA